MKSCTFKLRTTISHLYESLTFTNAYIINHRKVNSIQDVKFLSVLFYSRVFFFSTLPSQVLGGFNLPPPSQLFTLHQTVVESHTHRTSSLATITRSTARLLIISLLIRSRYFTPYLDQLLSRGPPRDLSSHGNHPNISNQRADWPLTLSTVVSDPQP